MLKQKFLVQFGSNISLKILALVAGIVVARVAGPEIIGVLAYATAFVGVFGFLLGIFGSSNIKLISEGKELGDCIATFTRLQLISFGFFFITVVGWFLFQKYVLNYDFKSVIQEQVIIIAIFTALATRLVNFSNSSYTGQLKQAKANMPLFYNGIVLQIGRIVVVFLGFKAVGLAGWNLISAVVILPIAYRLFKRLPYSQFSKKLSKEYIKYAIPIFFIVVLNSLMGNVDKLLLFKYTNAAELGYYSVAYSLGGMILLVSGTIGTIFFPLFSALIAKHDWETINNKINLFESFVTKFIFPFIFLAAIISDPLITTILGSKYQESVPPFTILLFASYFSIVGMPYSNIITGMGRFYLSLGLNVIKFIFFIGMLIYLISPQFLGLGAVGVALGVLFSNIINNGLFFLVSMKIGKIKMYYKNYFSYLIITLISIVIIGLRTYMIEASSLWWIIIIIPYLFLIYGSLFLTGLLKLAQVKDLLGLLNFRKTIKYINDEIKER